MNPKGIRLEGRKGGKEGGRKKGEGEKGNKLANTRKIYFNANILIF